ncbi:dsDNA nuclease domain-containing protein [Salinispora arenicola]|uniref:dsDNA nuclease domain-containing protein n=1 Tax=Salinispora arenicola TaxID=168697 RepID=UPI00036C0E21|nr:dsDNA nuclease domain-containing protein [Salinispora arenicola]
MTETKRQQVGPAVELLTKIAEVESNQTGLETFARYIWQAKQAVRQWLTCLSEQDGPLFAVCEQVEDLVLVYPDRVRFCQLKTRDKGSWSVAAMCDRGLDALVRSYNAARNTAIHELCTFELWVEGAIADKPDTIGFVQDPSSARKDIRGKLIANGLIRAQVDDFLQRLIVRPDQPTRAHIDAKAMWELWALWPALSRPEVEHLYERLLQAATAAQTGGFGQSGSIQAHLAAALPHVGCDLPGAPEPGGAAISAIRDQVLSQGMLTALTPPLPGESVEKLLARISAGSTASLMELKMMTAGAGRQLIERVQEMRADMEVQRQLLLASGDNAEADLERLAIRVLSMAEATASRVGLSAASNPAAAGRPAEAIAADLLARPADLAQCDRNPLFDRDEHLVLGYLGHLSDLCRFSWRP